MNEGVEKHKKQQKEILFMKSHIIHVRALNCTASESVREREKMREKTEKIFGYHERYFREQEKKLHKYLGDAEFTVWGPFYSRIFLST